MPTTTQPNIGLQAGWSANEANWGDKMNANLRAIDTLMQARVISSTLSAPPGGVSEGDTFIIAAAPGGDWSGRATQIARWSVTGLTTPAWEYFLPKIGWIVWDLGLGLPRRFTASGWVIGSTNVAGVEGLEQALLAKAPAAVPVVDVTVTALTLALGHAGSVVRIETATAATVTIPNNSAVAFPVGTVISVRQTGAGQATIAAGLGVALNVPSGLTAVARAAGSVLLIHKVSVNSWDLSGDGAPA